MELDIEDFAALRIYLAEHTHLKPDESVSFKKLFGGVSNRTVRVGWPDGRAWVLKQALAKLRVEVDWFSSPERIAVEAKALRWLNSLAPAGTTPEYIFEDPVNYLLAMAAVPEAHENWKQLLLSGQIVSDHFEQSGFLLGRIHRRSSEPGLELRLAFANTEYFESLRLDPYYRHSAKNVPAAAAFLDDLARETLLYKISLVHGDFSPKNILIYQGKFILLDYEVVHFGDPAFDVGFVFAHFLSKANHLGEKRDLMAAAALTFWRAYRREIDALPWAQEAEPRMVRHALACLLARVAGKSVLEYLEPHEIVRQREVVLALMATAPVRISDLVSEFIARIEAHAKN